MTKQSTSGEDEQRIMEGITEEMRRMEADGLIKFSPDGKVISLTNAGWAAVRDVYKRRTQDACDRLGEEIESHDMLFGEPYDFSLRQAFRYLLHRNYLDAYLETVYALPIGDWLKCILTRTCTRCGWAIPDCQCVK